MGYLRRHSDAFLVYAKCLHETVHDKWCLQKSVRQTENGLECGFVNPGYTPRGVARGATGVPVTPYPYPPLVGFLLSKRPTIFRWRKRHDNILAVKAVVEKPIFLKVVFL